MIIATSKKSRPEIEFVRVFSVYVRSENLVDYSFETTVCTTAAFRKKLGMTVDLSTLNRISAEVFLNCKIQGQPLQKFLQTKYQQLKKSLAKSKITLQSVTFLECRGLAIEFKGTSILTLRQDFATDDNGVLYSVSSYFDKVNKLKKLNLRNLKANIEEQFIF